MPPGFKPSTQSEDSQLRFNPHDQTPSEFLPSRNKPKMPDADSPAGSDTNDVSPFAFDANLLRQNITEETPREIQHDSSIHTPTDFNSSLNNADSHMQELDSDKLVAEKSSFDIKAH